MPAFSFRHVKDLYPVFWGKAKEMVDTVAASINKPSAETEKPDNVVEVQGWTSRATLDIIGIAGMGRDFNSLHDPTNKLAMVYKTIFTPPKYIRFLQLAGLFIPGWFLNNLPLKRNRDIKEAQDTIKDICRDLIREKKAKGEKSERSEIDILSVALESGSFTDDELVHQMMTLYVAFSGDFPSRILIQLQPCCRPRNDSNSHGLGRLRYVQASRGAEEAKGRGHL